MSTVQQSPIKHDAYSETDLLSEFTSPSDQLEDVLFGRNVRRETQPLLNGRRRSHSKIVSPNSRISFGVYNKNNYFSSCFNSCWVKNGKRGRRAQRLFCFGGGFSRSASILASFITCLFALLPFAAVWPFLFEKSTLKHGYLPGLLILTTSMEFVFFLWHFYCVYVIKTKNHETWIRSWFTFLVKKERLRNTENSLEILSLFHLEGKLRVIDVSVPDLCRLNSALHQLTVNERENLATRIEQNGLDEAAIILYSEEFINEFVMHPMYVGFILASLSASSSALLTWKSIITIS